jgi:hypothetical protein
VDTVRPNHHVRIGSRPVRERDRRSADVLAETRASVSGPHRACWQLRSQQRKQICPVDPNVPSWPSELIRLMPRWPAIEQQELSRHIPDADTFDAVANPQLLEHPQAVRCQRYARADLGQPLRLLMHLDIDAGLRQRNSRGHSASTATDNQRSQRHVTPLCERPRPTSS